MKMNQLIYFICAHERMSKTWLFHESIVVSVYEMDMFYSVAIFTDVYVFLQSCLVV